MIRWPLLFVAALALGGLLAGLMASDPGYVLVAFRNATLETSVWFAAATLGAAALLVWAIAFLLRRTLRGANALGAWNVSRRQRALRSKVQRGAMLLAEGRWQEAVQALPAPDSAETSLLDCFAAARAANEAGDTGLRDRILESAAENDPDVAFVAELMRSELQQARAEWADSVATLEALQSQAPRHPLVAARLFEAHRALGEWQRVAELAPLLPDDLDYDTQVAIWRSVLARIDGDDAGKQALAVWKSVPKALKDDEALVLDYADVLVRHGAEGEAEAVLRRSIKGRWRDAWALRYGTVEADAERMLATAAAWLKERPDNAALLLTLGRLAGRCGDGPGAKDYLQASVRAKPAPAALGELGAMSEAQGDAAAAAGYFRRALEARERDEARLKEDE